VQRRQPRRARGHQERARGAIGGETDAEGGRKAEAEGAEEETAACCAPEAEAVPACADDGERERYGGGAEAEAQRMSVPVRGGSCSAGE
jgi:hypothetical protein